MKNKKRLTPERKMLSEAWAKPTPRIPKIKARNFMKKIALQKIAGEKRTKMSKKTIPVLMNRAQLAEETNFPLRKLYRVEIEPDARDRKGAPLFDVSRLSEISRILNARRPEILT